MSSTSALECNEDLENVTLVRMEDVQPDRSSDVYVLDTSPYVNSVIDHDYSCVFNDEDSNIGSMVLIQSEEVEDFIESQDECKTSEFVVSNPDSWPTLEILPGGVIKHSETFTTSFKSSLHQNKIKEKDMMYACAKCSQRFKFLYNLVKHVKLHETERKKLLSNKQKVEAKAVKSGKLKKKKRERRKYLKCKQMKDMVEKKI
ncbi:uncharacterized protein LOC123878236 [Maniola jurtina]|uniref:uncharacterized protein LOC123878236 n=1 Tax=Maniola jurtina TaxID=191418 RepID=UPI001E68B7E0|nr:uncharacterized protein LOC123878236 [Maniola jurtina]XP_045781343.1 uncharacterized protein LOC123878236 [Maniola jurtina]